MPKQPLPSEEICASVVAVPACGVAISFLKLNFKDTFACKRSKTKTLSKTFPCPHIITCKI